MTLMSTSRSAINSKLGFVAVVAVASVVLSGCFLRSIVGFVNGDGQVRISANIEATRCQEALTLGGFRCTITYFDDSGREVAVDSEVRLTDFGLIGVFIDPLVLQVPDDATNVVATYNNAGADEPAVVTETTSFNVTPSITVDAEPGTRFLIVELPDSVLATLSDVPMDFNFSLGFDVNGPSALSVKAMLTGRVDYENSTYYVPLYPCVTDFAQVPSVVIPSGSTFQDIRTQVIDILGNQPDLGCDDVTYGPSTTVPSTTLPAATTVAPTTVAPTTVAATTTAMATTTTGEPATTVAATTSTDVSPAGGDAAATTTSTTAAPPIMSLPETGSPTVVQVWMALMALVGGALVVLASRRRSSW